MKGGCFGPRNALVAVCLPLGHLWNQVNTFKLYETCLVRLLKKIHTLINPGDLNPSGGVLILWRADYPKLSN